MCLAASIYEAHKQKKAADKAQKQAKAAASAATARAEAERNISTAQEAAEEQTLDAGETSELSAAKRRHGVASTYLNQSLGV